LRNPPGKTILINEIKDDSRFMKFRQLQKFILNFGMILSLAASSLAACLCSHHAVAKAKDHTPSCHQTAPKNDQTETVENDSKNQFPVVGESCNCFVKISQPFIVGKSENVKAQKTLAILPGQIRAGTFELTSKNETPKMHFEYHFYNSNYLKELTPPRAPPVL
jgi:hypothetical protein